MKSEIKYKVGNKTFLYNKGRAHESYLKYCEMSDEEFIKNILDILHFAVYICFIKDLKTKDILCDDGLIHQLVHLTKSNTREYVNLKKIRNNFKKNLHIKNQILTFPKI